MRFGLVHRVMTNALAALGVLALVASGELGRWVNVAIVFGLVGALMVPEAWHARPWLNRIATIGPVILLAVQVGRSFLGRPLLELAVEFAAALQIVRLATRRGAAHDQQVIVLALLHLIAGTVLGGGLGYGLCFIGFLVVAPGALVLSHLRREVEGNYRQGARDRTGLPVDVPRILRSRRVVGRTFLGVTCLLALPILLFTTTLFLVFPRVGLSLLLLRREHGGRMVGFSDRVDLGGVGTLRDDPTIALRVDVTDLPEPPPERVTLYLRGTAFDAYDGRAWSRTEARRDEARRETGQIVIERRGDPARDRLLRMDLEPIDPPVIFLPPNSVSMMVSSRNEAPLVGSPSLSVKRGPEGEFRYASREDRGIRYDVYLSRTPIVHPAPMAREDLGRYLAVPPLPPRVAELAEEWTQSAVTPLEKAKAVETHLRSGYRYDLSSPSGGALSPLDHFLFESKRGHCEFYSSSMAVLLRFAGVPTRNVTGFIGGTYNRFSRNYTVRQGDAHSWVEAYIDGVGWMTFDPTPPADAAPRSEIRGVLALLRDVLEASSQRWDRHVVGYDLRQQISLLDRFRGFARRTTPMLPAGSGKWLFWIAAAAVVGATGGYVYIRRKKTIVAPTHGPQDSRARAVTVVTALYETLDGAMAAQGMARPQGTPPLRHALGSAVRAHALAEEVLELTRIYLDVRFGGSELDEDARRDFERRVKTVRGFKGTAPAEI
jgi:protein-glutamine gamma-glutamyltransferase